MDDNCHLNDLKLGNNQRNNGLWTGFLCVINTFIRKCSTMYSKVIRWTFTENSEWYYGTYGKWLFYILANIWVQSRNKLSVMV